MTLRWIATLLALAVVDCSGSSGRPQGPAPEYERPVLPPWDSGAGAEPEDPFEAAAEGDWVEEPLETPPAGDASVTTDASPDGFAAEGGVSPEAGLVVPDAGETG